jgi:PAS domain S-box-containing protein
LLLVTFFGLWYLKRLVTQRTKHLEFEIQQRKEVDKELLESHDLLANLARLVPGVVYQYRLYPDGRSAFPYSSPGMNNIYEVTPEEVQDDATPVFGRLHPDDFDKVSNSIQESARTLRTFVCEFRVNLPNQGLRWRWSQAQPERMPDGGTLWHGIISDITELKQAEQKLQESEKRFQQMFMNAPMPYQSLDEQGNFLDVNQAFLDILGYSRGEVIGKNFGDILHPDWVSHFKNNFPRFRSIGEILGVEFEMVKKDGSTILVYFNGKVQLDEQGRFQRTHCIFQDITERRRIEVALVKSEKDLKKSQRIALVGSWRLDLATNQVEWTEELYRMYGFDPTLPPPPYTEHMKLFTPESWERLSSALSATSTTGIPYELELETVRDDGSNGWMWVRGEAVNDAAGNIIGLWGAAQDITDRKAFEAERVKLQAQLTQAQKMESVGRLAGGVAHDFNNMLSVILGHTEMALEEMDPAEPLFASLQAIQQAAERSTALTRQLLTFARKQTVAPKIIDLNETVEKMLKMLRRLIGEDIDLAWLPGKNLSPVKVDPSQIDQILANLCVNSRDAIVDVGKITIETGVVSFDDAYCAEHAGFRPGEYILLAVSDDGCGMDRETRGQIFEPFFTTKEQGRGTGLGLASVYGAVKQNNGFINVYSEPGQGTTFRIYLPGYTGKSVSVAEKVPDRPAERGHETILLVEDEPAILEMTMRMLGRLGYTVLTANTPGEVIRLAQEHTGRIDLLLTDVVMPEMNGRDLAKNLLAIYPDIRQLFMSGYTANVIAHQGVLDEGVHFIQKPFSMKDLGGKLREVLEG